MPFQEAVEHLLYLYILKFMCKSIAVTPAVAINAAMRTASVYIHSIIT